MFYCDPCRKARQWPISFSLSSGNCEVCGDLAHCYDVPSGYLSIPVPVVPGPKIYHGRHREEDKHG